LGSGKFANNVSGQKKSGYWEPRDFSGLVFPGAYHKTREIQKFSQKKPPKKFF